MSLQDVDITTTIQWVHYFPFGHVLILLMRLVTSWNANHSTL